MKQKFLEAITELIEQYESNTWDCNVISCPLCKLIADPHHQLLSCKKCILYNSAIAGKSCSPYSCNMMNTYPDQHEGDYTLRILFWKQSQIILERLPEYRFTMLCDGIPRFPELWELDRKIHKGEK